MPGLSDADLHAEFSSDLLLTSTTFTEDGGVNLADRSRSDRSSVSSFTSYAIGPIKSELDCNARWQATSDDWPTLEKKSLQAAPARSLSPARTLRAPCAPPAHPLHVPIEASGELRQLEGDTQKLHCESCIARLHTEQQAGLAEMRSTAARLEAAIADCRRELEAQREQILLQADAALEAARTARETVQNASRVSSQDASRKVIREVSLESAQEYARQVRHAPRSLPTPVVAAVEIQKLRMETPAEHELSEIEGVNESAHVSGEELHSEMTCRLLQRNNATEVVAASAKAETALISAPRDIMSRPRTWVRDLGAHLSTARHHEPLEDNVPSLRRSFDIMSRSMGRLAQDFEARFGIATELAAADRAELADLRSLFQDAFRALATEVAEERADRCVAVDQVIKRSDALALKITALIDEVSEASWNGLIVGHERSRGS